MTDTEIEIISKIIYQNEMLIDMNWAIINSIIPRSDDNDDDEQQPTRMMQ